MRIVSSQFTNRVQTDDQIEMVVPGTPFEIDDAKAREKIAAGRAEPFSESEDAPAAAEPAPHAPDAGGGEERPSTEESDGEDEFVLEKVTEAILNLDADKPDHFLADGRPNVKAINELVAEDLGRSVTADERDTAWAALQPEE